MEDRALHQYGKIKIYNSINVKAKLALHMAEDL